MIITESTPLLPSAKHEDFPSAYVPIWWLEHQKCLPDDACIGWISPSSLTDYFSNQMHQFAKEIALMRTSFPYCKCKAYKQQFFRLVNTVLVLQVYPFSRYL